MGSMRYFAVARCDAGLPKCVERKYAGGAVGVRVPAGAMMYSEIPRVEYRVCVLELRFEEW